MKTVILLSLFLQITIASAGEDVKFIYPNNDKIYISGAFFLLKSKECVVINRFNTTFLEMKETLMNAKKANTQTGVSVSFSTNSQNMKVIFKERQDAEHRQKVFGIFKNGEFFTEINSLELEFENLEGQVKTEWEVVLPSFYGLDFGGIEIDTNADLYKTTRVKRPVYVAIGNSITHGVGQNGAGFLTYPFLLAKQKDWQLYNLAVGGSKISWSVAQLLKNREVNIITILWGYNDWNGGFTTENDIRPNYIKLLEELRKVQPTAKIYCILPTVSKRKTPKTGKQSLEEVRLCQLDCVTCLQREGDDNLFIIKGADITTEKDLNDDVHLSVSGAANFAQNLGEIIN